MQIVQRCRSLVALRDLARFAAGLACVTACVVACLVVSATLQAQTRAAPVSGPPVDLYARYHRPGQCRQAAFRLMQLYWRVRRMDTVVYAPETDTVPASVSRELRACAAHFTPAAVSTHDLLDLVRLYVWTHQRDLARIALDRFFAAQNTRSDADRAWTLQQLVEELVSAHPAQIDNARLVAAKLDALGPTANYAKFQVHQLLSRYAMSVNQLATAESEAQTAIRDGQQMPNNDRLDWTYDMIGSYGALAEPTTLTAGGAAALAVLDRAATDLLPLRPAGSEGLMNLQQVIANARVPYTLVGTKVPPVHGTHWYGTQGDTMLRPEPGHVTLLYFANAMCGGNCYSQYATLRRLYAKYTAAGLQIVMMTSTVGYFRNHLQPDPATESDKDQSYFFDFLKLPGVLAVEETQFSHKADGRRVNAISSNQRNYWRGRGTVLVGKDGVVRMVTDAVPAREMAVDAEIARALR